MICPHCGKDVIKQGDICSYVIEHLNSKTGAKYKATTPKTRTLIKARQREGFVLEDFYSVIDKKVADWQNDSMMSKYLNPLTLFGTKFEKYLNELTVKRPDYKDAVADLMGDTDGWD